MQAVLSVIAIIIVAIAMGKLASKVKLPSILGWLIAGMIFGPYLGGIVGIDTLNEEWYLIVVKTFETLAGVMIGSEIVFKKLAKSGKQITIITLVQSIGTFIVVTLAFLLALYVMNLPLYLSVIFGGIALATAPAPALSIVNEFKTEGPVTDTLLPVAAIDDVIAIVIFLTIISILSGSLGALSIPPLTVVLMTLLPFVIGIVIGLIATQVIKRVKDSNTAMFIMVGFLLLSVAVGLLIDVLYFKDYLLNYLLIGMAFSGTVANLISEDQLEKILKAYNPILSISFVIVIVNLGMPLDYKLILGAGLFTAIYIIVRAIGKIGGSYLGGKLSKADDNITKYLGFTLLPHSGVSLVFTGIAVGMLNGVDTEAATIIQGTIAAAAIINEIIAVILAKQGFKWAGELNQDLVK